MPPIALTPDQIEQVVGGLASAVNVALRSGGGGTTTGAIPPQLPISFLPFAAS